MDKKKSIAILEECAKQLENMTQEEFDNKRKLQEQ
jgi:hypothetical protein